MQTELYRYVFSETVPMDDVEGTLVLAIFGAQALHGEIRFRMDAAHAFDAQLRSCVIDANTQVGRDFNRLFAGFARHEYGDEAFTVRRISEAANKPIIEVAA